MELTELKDEDKLETEETTELDAPESPPDPPPQADKHRVKESADRIDNRLRMKFLSEKKMT